MKSSALATLIAFNGIVLAAKSCQEHIRMMTETHRKYCNKKVVYFYGTWNSIAHQYKLPTGDDKDCYWKYSFVVEDPFFKYLVQETFHLRLTSQVKCPANPEILYSTMFDPNNSRSEVSVTYQGLSKNFLRTCCERFLWWLASRCLRQPKQSCRIPKTD